VRLYPLGPGEILDRLTILSLKILHGGMAGRSIEHWKAEYAYLNEEKYSPCVSRATSYFADLQAAILDLAAVNGAIWTAEDELRRWQGEGCGPCSLPQAMTVAVVALRAQSLNDRRAQLIAEINTLLGAEAPEEKIT